MPDISPNKQQVSPEELTGVGKNRRFDEKLDDEDDYEIEVIYKRGEKEISLAKPSRAVYFGDRAVYDQESSLFRQSELTAILSLQEFPRNDQYFGDLQRGCRHGIVIPFVGAGMSVSAGCPSWRQYLINLCREARLDESTIAARLDEQSDYESVMEEIIDALGQPRFERDFERDFNKIDITQGAVSMLPKLFGNCAITTNFDRVAEEAWSKANIPFREKLFGRGNSGAFFRAVASGDRYLLKLHGNLDSPGERILRKSEYDLGYGEGGNIHFESPLPKLLRRLYMSYSLLFVGCSLAADRTIQTFMRVANQEGAGNVPHHYALLSCPLDPGKRQIMEDRLAHAHITPIWYPDGEHGRVEEVLQLLLD
ncbi:MAG TPA: SIR2 family protein [Burkholderiales bacterium]|jgi:hypothetical protein|nr:SIR2 family protein [Burkholderiales bacterium]